MTTPDDRPYSPGLQGVLAGETTIALVDGENGRLIYRGYAIGELVRKGTYAQVAELLWAGDWPRATSLCPARRPPGSLRNLPDRPSYDALAPPFHGRRSGRSGRDHREASAVTAIAPSALAAFCRLARLEPSSRTSTWTSGGFLYQLNGERPDEASARALDAYFITGAEHGFNASTFTARVITSTQSDIASAVAGGSGP
jgi:citrate synthase